MKKHPRMVPLFVTDDELSMLHDRVSTGVEMSEEGGWDELLTKVNRARGLLQHSTDPRNTKYALPDADRRLAVDCIVAKFWPPGYHSLREITDAIFAYIDHELGAERDADGGGA